MNQIMKKKLKIKINKVKCYNFLFRKCSKESMNLLSFI
jgi:hypothetical protein